MTPPAASATPLALIDAFCDGPFTGNPAAVCVLDIDHPRRGDAAWMQRVASEMNQSETAFVEPPDDAPEAAPAPAPGKPGKGSRHLFRGWGLRWFTPAAEVELCGHATLASAHLLWETGRADAAKPIAFVTRHSGELTCVRRGDGGVAMDFPADEPTLDTPPPERLLGSLGLSGDDVAAVARGKYDWLIEAATPAAVLGLAPDFAAMRRFDTRGVAVTAWARDADAPAELAGIDIVSRFFAPRLRIDEDPVTGSLHCLLGPYWKSRRGVDAVTAFQASRRGGRLGVTTRGDRVELLGRAVTVARGELLH